MILESGVVAHTYDPIPGKMRQEDQGFQACLSYISPCLGEGGDLKILSIKKKKNLQAAHLHTTLHTRVGNIFIIQFCQSIENCS